MKNSNKSINEHYGLEDEDISHPTNYKIIMQKQQNDKDLIKIVQNNKIILYRIFMGASCDPQTIRKTSCRVVP